MNNVHEGCKGQHDAIEEDHKDLRKEESLHTFDATSNSLHEALKAQCRQHGGQL